MLIAKRSILEKLCNTFNIHLKEHSNTTRLTLSAIGEHLRDTDHKLEESKAAVVAREENNFRRRIHDALEILCLSQHSMGTVDLNFQLCTGCFSM